MTGETCGFGERKIRALVDSAEVSVWTAGAPWACHVCEIRHDGAIKYHQAHDWQGRPHGGPETDWIDSPAFPQPARPGGSRLSEADYAAALSMMREKADRLANVKGVIRRLLAEGKSPGGPEMVEAYRDWISDYWNRENTVDPGVVAGWALSMAG